ncbi:tissue factor pathway inhibitor 2-like [Dermacentor silvarum]|uniref:tissue factor pathway inhibitor 2-like n=1 Tax=Dermacentor silvarum TaxID=543639 RepID=UPI00189A59DB|nr:tissue factor pathway inhibitor 2-like [Dermacentor silvarum]
MAAFTFGLPLLLFVVVVIISYAFIASPCQESPEWRECVPLLPNSSYYYDAKLDDCLRWDSLPKGCLNDSNGFENLKLCQQTCNFTTRKASGKPQGNDCWNAVIGEACDERLHKLQYFFNPLRSSCKDLNDLCLAGRNRFPNYTACAETCLPRDDSNARRRHQEVSRG